MTAAPSKIAAWAQQMASVQAARTFIEACEGEGIPVLPVKGIVSGCTLYEDRAQRPLTDVDVRVLPSDVRRVAALCRARGWPIAQHMRSYANLVAVVDNVQVDVEAHVGPPGMCDLRVSAMMTRAHLDDTLGFRCRMPDFTDHAVLLVVNAFKDKLVGAFEWAIRDLEEIPRRAEFDPRDIAARLQEARCTTIGFFVADWMVRARGATEWQQVVDALGQPRRRRYLRTMRELIDRNGVGLAARVLGRMGADSPRMRIRALLTMVAWRGEVVVSQLGPAPYVRGQVNDDVRAHSQ